MRVLDGGDSVYLAGGSKWEDALLSYLGRVNYAYADKYLLTASLRYDGSSRFSPDNRWGVFPAASVGWRISEEEFFRGVMEGTGIKDRKSTRLNSSHVAISYAVFCLKKKKTFQKEYA